MEMHNKIDGLIEMALVETSHNLVCYFPDIDKRQGLKLTTRRAIKLLQAQLSELEVLTDKH